MRNYFSSLFLSIRCLFVLIAFFLPSSVHAQFQEPTPDELKMTADPASPGAAAVYLYKEETTDDNLHYHGYYVRIKVLTEKGKSLATVHIPYDRSAFKVSDIKGRTIHPDGTVVPLTATPTDLTDIKNNSLHVNEMVFTLPDATVGSILEYRLELRYDDSIVSSPDWRIQEPYYIHKAHYMFTPAKTGGIHYITDNNGMALDKLLYAVIGFPMTAVKVDTQGRFTADFTDIQAIPDEDWMPPANNVRGRVQFYYSFASSGKEYWEVAGKKWQKESEHFLDCSKQMSDAAAQIVAPTDTAEQKARKIYAAVMKLDNTAFSRTKSEAELKAEKMKFAKNAGEVWERKSGTDDQLAMLYVGLARAAGLKAWVAQIVNRRRAIFDLNYLSTRQLDDYIAIVEIDGKDVYLDPGQRMCDYGQMAWQHYIASGLRTSAQGVKIVTTSGNVYSSAIVKRVANIEIDPTGTAKGTIAVAMIGPDALHWRQLALRNDEEEVKKQFNNYIRNEVPEGMETELDHFTGMDNPTANLVAYVKLSGNLGTTTGKRVFLPGLFFQTHSKLPFVTQDKRVSPIDVHYAKLSSDNVTYHVPAGYAVESLPPATDLNWPSSAILKITTTQKGNVIDVTRLFAHNYTILGPNDYKDLHDFYQKIATADQTQVVLTRPANAAGDAKGN